MTLSRRNFLKRGSVWVPAICIPKLIRANPYLGVASSSVVSSGSASFPTVPGLLARYKSSLGTNTTTEGGAVSQWDDQSGNGYHAAQATASKQPTYRANVKNGKPAIRFDGSDGLVISSFPLATQQVTVFVVGSAAAGGAAVQAFFESSATIDTQGGVFLGRGTTANRVEFALKGSAGYSAWGSSEAVDTTAALMIGFYDVSLTTNEATGEVKNNASGSSLANDNNGAFNFGTADANIGSRGNATSLWLTGDIFEILVYTSIISGANLTNLKAYFTSEYAV